MTTFPTPRLIKGAIVSMDLRNSLASEIMFQFNPETLTRTLQTICGEQNVTGAPREQDDR